MRLHLIDHFSAATCLSTSLVVATGILFGLLCFLIFLLESVVKLIAIPFILGFGLASLAYGLVKRKLFIRIKLHS